MGGRKRTPAIVFVAAMLAAAPASADAPSVRVRVGGSAPCAREGALDARLAERGVRTTSDPSATDVEVTLDPSAEGFAGVYAIHPFEARRIAASTCDEVLDAVAFALAVALGDERAPEAPPPPPIEKSAETPKAVERPPPAPLVDRRPLGLAVAIDAGAQSGLGPEVGAAVGAFVDAVWRTPRFEPGVRAGLVLVLPASGAPNGYAVRVAMQGASLDACPARGRLGPFGGTACARARIGRLQAESSGFSGARLQNTLWMDLGVALRGDLRIVGPIALEVEL